MAKRIVVVTKDTTLEEKFDALILAGDINGFIVDARKLHLFLESKRQFADWFKQIVKRHNLVENQDYKSFHKSVKREIGSSIRKEYTLISKKAQRIAVKANTDIGDKLADYLYDLGKKQITKQIEIPNFNDPVIAARAWADQLEQKLLLEKENKKKEIVITNQEKVINKQKPKAHFYDKTINSHSLFSMEEVAKTLVMKKDKVILGRNLLFRILREEKILNYDNNPFQKYINKGWFKIVQTTYKVVNEDGQEEVRLGRKTMVYQKGIDGILTILEEIGWKQWKARTQPILIKHHH